MPVATRIAHGRFNRSIIAYQCGMINMAVTSINCKTGFWMIDTQAVARITWHPEDDTFTFEGARYSRTEMTAILETLEMGQEIDGDHLDRDGLFGVLG